MPVLWAIIPLTAVNYAPAATIRGLWAGPYLDQVYGAGSLLIGNVALAMAIAMVIGSFAYGPLDTLLRTRKWVAFGGNAASFSILVALVLVPMPPFAFAAAALVAIGLFGTSPAHLTGRGVTLMNFFSIGGAGLIQFATGPVFGSAYDRANPASAYSTLFGFYALLLAIGLAIYIFSRDARPGERVSSSVAR
jgi:hypothetical protein